MGLFNLKMEPTSPPPSCLWCVWPYLDYKYKHGTTYLLNDLYVRSLFTLSKHTYSLGFPPYIIGSRHPNWHIGLYKPALYDPKQLNGPGQLWMPQPSYLPPLLELQAVMYFLVGGLQSFFHEWLPKPFELFLGNLPIKMEFFIWRE
jgi:hypothetical protein